MEPTKHDRYTHIEKFKEQYEKIIKKNLQVLQRKRDLGRENVGAFAYYHCIRSTKKHEQISSKRSQQGGRFFMPLSFSSILYFAKKCYPQNQPHQFFRKNPQDGHSISCFCAQKSTGCDHQPMLSSAFCYLRSRNSFHADFHGVLPVYSAPSLSKVCTHSA